MESAVPGQARPRHPHLPTPGSPGGPASSPLDEANVRNTAVQTPRVLHATPGRLRVRAAAQSGRHRGMLEQRLRLVPGVHGAQVNPRTGNLLIHFDPRAVTAPVLLGALDAFERESPHPTAEEASPRPASSPTGLVRQLLPESLASFADAAPPWGPMLAAGPVAVRCLAVL